MTRLARFRDRLIRRLDDPTVGPPTLLGVSFLESTFVPIPIEFALVPLMAAARSRLWSIATIALAGTLAGALAGYMIGYFFFDSLGNWLLDWTNTRAGFEAFTAELQDQGFWVIVFVGISALPFKIATLGAGAIAFDFTFFCLATLLARVPRYYGLALLVQLFGRKVTSQLKQHRRTAVIVTAIGIAAFVVWQFIR